MCVLPLFILSILLYSLLPVVHHSSPTDSHKAENNTTKMKAIMTGLAALHCASALTQNEVSFSLYKDHFGKTYKADEEQARFAAFEASLERVAKSGNPASGLTQFSDMTQEDFKRTYANRRGKALPADAPRWNGECTACNRFPEHATQSFAEGFDWTTKGAVTAVKNQGQCGSCWSFGTTGDIEGTWFLKGNPLQALSEQQLVSCDKTDDGCGGGLQENAFKWIMKNGGIASEADYPYKSGFGIRHLCVEGHKSVANITKWFQVSDKASQESDISNQLAQVGPITIGIDATPMQDYRGGIDSPKNCGSSARDLDHAVLIVGFGTENGVDYWKIKNSWAASWGEEGYYRIVRGENKCGVAMDAVHSVV